jgi:hypothetical protein
MISSFSFSRLFKLIRKQGIENSRFYLLSTLALIGLLAISFAFWIIGSHHRYLEQDTYIMYLFGLFFAGTIFASISFSMLGEKDKGTYWLVFPASHFEKLCCCLFYTVIVFAIVYTTSFFLVKSIAVAYIKSTVEENGGEYINWNNGNGFRKVFPYFIEGFFVIQALYMMGSVYFARYSFIIITILAATVIFCFGWYIVEISNSFDRTLYNWEIFSVKSYQQTSSGGLENNYKLYSIGDRLINSILFLVKFGIAPVLWTITYFRLREKEI